MAGMVLVLAGCGAQSAPVIRPSRTFDPLPAVGAAFVGRHRVVASLDGVELTTLRARVQMWVVERREAEVDLWARVHLLVAEGGEAAFDDVRLTMDATGRVSRLRSLCTTAAFDELASTRLVWTMLGVGPSWASGVPTDGGIVRSELDERASAGTFRHREEEGGITVLGRGELNLLGVVLSGVRLRGPASIRVRQRFEHHSLLVRRTSSLLEGTLQASSGTGTRPALLSVESDSVLEDDTPSAPPAAACALGTPAANTESVDQGMLFAAQTVIDAVHAHQREITRCYEARLSFNPELRGRVRVSMTVQESGEVTDVRVIEDTLDDDEVAHCVVVIVNRFSFDPGPTDGSATYAFPFVFSPAAE